MKELLKRPILLRLRFGILKIILPKKTFVLTKDMGLDTERFEGIEYASKDFVLLSFCDDEWRNNWYELWDLRNGESKTLLPEIPGNESQLSGINWMFDQKAKIFVCNVIGSHISIPVIFDFDTKLMKKVITYSPQVQRTLYFDSADFSYPRFKL